MKCIKHVQTKDITRVSDAEANAAVSAGRWKYCPKLEWKEAGRPTRKRGLLRGVPDRSGHLAHKTQEEH